MINNFFGLINDYLWLNIKMFMSTHYVGEDIAIKLEIGEYWKKVLGPVYVYLNSDARAKSNPSVLWEDAKQRVYIYNNFININWLNFG